MAVRLREFRFDNLAIPPGTSVSRDVGMAIAAAFREYNLPVTDLPVAEVAGRVRDSRLREELLTGLDVWSVWDVQNGGGTWKQLLAVAQAADDDPWRRKCRDAALRGDFAALTELARREESPRQPAEAVLLLATFLVGPPRPEGRAATDEERSVANALLEKAEAWHPEDTRIGMALAAWFPGTSRVVADNPETARETIKRLTQIGASPESLAAAYISLAKLLVWNKDKVGAATACRQAVRLMPDRAEYRKMLFFNLSNDDERIAACTDWIRSGPVSPMPYQERSQIYLNRKQWPEALSDVTKWMEIMPEDPGAWYSRAQILLYSGQVDESLAASTTAIELATRKGINLLPYLLARSWTYRGNREWDKAIADLTRAIELEPKNGCYWAFRGDAYRGKGDLQKAMADYDTALENPVPNNIGRGLEGRGDVNKQLGRWDAAIRDWTEELKLHPKNTPVAQELFRLLIDCPDPAHRDPQSALELDKKIGPLFDGDQRRRMLEKAMELMTTQEKEP
jgi:tetratricopeptide (TPR) repeat protein